MTFTIESLNWEQVQQRTQLRRELDTLLCEGFGTQEYIKTFPNVFCKKSVASHWVSCNDNGELVSYLNATPLHFSWKGVDVRGACLGSIVTAKASQGQGLAYELIRSAEKTLKRLGFDFLCLFSQGGGLYERADFQPGLEEQLIPISELAPPQGKQEAVKAKFQLGEENSEERLFSVWDELYAHETQEGYRPVEWNRQNFAKLVRAHACRTLSLWQEGRCWAFAIYEKGADFESTWHLLRALNPASCGSLLAQMQKHTPNAQIHLSPKSDQLCAKMIVHFARMGSVHRFSSEMIKPLNAKIQDLILAGFYPDIPSLLSC